MKEKAWFLLLGFVLGLAVVLLLGAGGDPGKRFELHLGGPQQSIPFVLDSVTGDVKILGSFNPGRIVPWKEQ
jgi:hypothetical protein